MIKVSSISPFWLFLIIPVVLISVFNMLPFRKSDKKTIRHFEKRNQEIVIDNYELNGRSIRYVMAQKYNPKLPLVVFIHGAPGSSHDFKKYMADSELYSSANLISVDRLGYGYSGYGEVETSITKQAEIINGLVNQFDNDKTLLVSWSFGGPISAKMSLLNPNIDAVLMIAPAVDPDYEKHFIMGYFAQWKATKWMVPKGFVMAEIEKNTHVDELIAMKSDWSKIHIPIVHMHGNKDGLVPFENLAYSIKNINSTFLTPIEVDKAKHTLPLTRYQLVKDEIVKLLGNFHPVQP